MIFAVLAPLLAGVLPAMVIEALGVTLAIWQAALLGGVMGLLLVASANVRVRRTNARGTWDTFMLVFRPEELSVARWSGWRKRPTGQRSRHRRGETPVRYASTDFAVDTRLFVGDEEWHVHGWFERDLKAALTSSDWLQESASLANFTPGPSDD